MCRKIHINVRLAKSQNLSSSTTGLRAKTSTVAERVGTASRTQKKETPYQSTTDPVESLIYCTTPMLELFAVVDDVFTEDDAFSSEKLRAGLGRIYRQWKKSRVVLDPDFAEENW